MSKSKPKGKQEQKPEKKTAQVQDRAEHADQEKAELTEELQAEKAEASRDQEEPSQDIGPDQAADYAKLNDQYMRLAAEYDNFRKRTTKEKEAIYGSALCDVCRSWLPVLDNIDRAIGALEKLESKESQQMLEGIEMIRKQAKETMEQLGVEEIDSLGQSFDPVYHEAIAHIVDDQYGENEIFEVVKKGYKKDDQVIRHSQVCVAN